MSDSRTVTVRRLVESTYGTTPTNSANWLTFCLNSETLSASPQTTTTGKQCPGSSGRMPQSSVIETTTSGGDVVTELSAGDYDDLIEAAMGGTWSTNSLTVGTTDRSFSLEKAFADQTKWLQLKGQRVVGMSINAGGGPVSATFRFAGSTAIANAVASLMGSGSETGESGENSMSSAAGSGSFEIDGSGVTPGTGTAIFTRVSIDLNNNPNPLNGLGQTTPFDVSTGLANFTGQIEGFLTGATGWDLYERALANSDLDFKFTLSENSKSYTFDLPKLKVRGEAPRIEGANSTLRFSFGFEAIQTAPIITRVP